MLQILPWLPSGLYLSGLLAVSVSQPQCWRILAVLTRGALAAALIGLGVAMLGPVGSASGTDARTASIVMALVAFLGWIIGDYASRYLRGEPGQPRFVQAFLLTLAAVTTVVASGNLALLIAGWVVSSIGLHHLLTFYRDRPAAIIVAHKKFLASRLAESLLIAAAFLLYRHWGTLDLAALCERAAGASADPVLQAAMVLIAAAVAIKCAQLPLHGWLIQVMEAPTPVSALLHAGVVNLGGYVLIRLAPLLAASPGAQALLVVVGSLSAALAGLVMLTRITIKVRLAWSTCSQMGLMLMECGLGLPDLALLHLIAHALYKAHAFLTAGDAVRSGLTRKIIAARRDVLLASPLLPLFGLLGAAALTAASVTLWQAYLGLAPLPWIALLLPACGLATMLWSPGTNARHMLPMLLAIGVGMQICLGWHWLFGTRLGLRIFPAVGLLSAWSLAVLLALYAAQAWILSRPAGALATRAYDWIYAGFYLDERFTRLTFRLWPLRMPDAAGPESDHELAARHGSAA